MGLYTGSGIFSGTSNSGKEGGIIQTKYTPVRAVQSYSGNGINMSAFATSITPCSTNSKIIIWVNFGACSGSGANSLTFEIRRNGSSINDMRGDASGSRPRRTFRHYRFANGDSNHTYSLGFMAQDFPATTSAIEYNLFSHPESNQTSYINRTQNDGNGGDNYQARCMSSMMVMEVGDT